MFDTLLQIADELNKGNLTKAGKMILELAKEEDDEKILRVSSEIEKILRDLNSRESVLDDFEDEDMELRKIEKEMDELRMRKLKVLSIYVLRKLSKGNLIIENMIKKYPTAQRPQTYM
ncbi:hypothetical protein L3N51_00350 [Metallosphaera sp. J1]|uniref:hypothetical protein n=1 Tax=Metallosphaera TaxID=41980 RepID=UPI001EDD8DC9|nr:hypothetical protein [Metallosphaera javensis (ex Hofmann et al. 2022)]MCG3108070.1 hypothetical protein [Metallosphaera javensis (ex Hofmann et al. 2022)]BCS94078.1 MAG: hypothetical protein MjAS7_2686 [Metallosphaera javensis (ex Sakai et al. 2022)]